MSDWTSRTAYCPNDADDLPLPRSPDEEQQLCTGGRGFEINESRTHGSVN